MIQNIDIDELEKKVNSTIKTGYCFLPEFKWEGDQEMIQSLVASKTKTYSAKHNLHDEYCQKTGIFKYLLPILQTKTKLLLNTSKNFDDIYQITRIVDQSEKGESYRTHFDSHLFTLVTPIQIPKIENSKDSGQLIVFPKIRQEPKNELKNILEKAYFKRYTSERAISKLKNKTKHVEIDLQDRTPLLFLGRQCLHCNRPFHSENGQHRITFLTHFFDSSPKWGLGQINRMLRQR